jgi:hypothetical protein
MGVCPLLGRAAAGLKRLRTRGWSALLGAVFYLLYGGFGLGFGYYLFSYAKTIGVFTSSGHAAHLEAALVAQKSFWKLVGIFAIVLLGVMLLGGLFLAIIPLMMKGM